MKLSELRPCDNCKGPIRLGFQVVRISQALVNASAANEIIGLTKMFQGALGLAEVMGSRPDDAVMVLGDKAPELMTQLFICNDCYLMKPIDLARLAERKHEDDQRAKERMLAQATFEEGVVAPDDSEVVRAGPPMDGAASDHCAG